MIISMLNLPLVICVLLITALYVQYLILLRVKFEKLCVIVNTIDSLTHHQIVSPDN